MCIPGFLNLGLLNAGFFCAFTAKNIRFKWPGSLAQLGVNKVREQVKL